LAPNGKERSAAVAGSVVAILSVAFLRVAPVPVIVAAAAIVSSPFGNGDGLRLEFAPVSLGPQRGRRDL